MGDVILVDVVFLLDKTVAPPTNCPLLDKRTAPTLEESPFGRRIILLPAVVKTTAFPSPETSRPASEVPSASVCARINAPPACW